MTRRDFLGVIGLQAARLRRDGEDPPAARFEFQGKVNYSPHEVERGLAYLAVWVGDEAVTVIGDTDLPIIQWLMENRQFRGEFVCRAKE